MFLMSALTLTDGLCCALFIYPTLVGVGPTEQVTPEDGEERIQSPKRCVLNKSRTMDSAQKHNNWINILCSAMFSTQHAPQRAAANTAFFQNDHKQ
jgi:hypothetical protein